jgi:hypothetical protein
MITEMNATQRRAPDPHARSAIAREQVTDLVARYPNLDEIELARLINSYRDLSAMDFALMISDEALAPKMDRFATDHRSKIRTPFRHYAALVAYAILAVMAVGWAASFATKGV